ncbi:MAG: Ribose 5-phosphate isomerase B [Clostridiales bacterium 38_11]|nr:MAG: Ribose 5-phosphate isomerase B [Clostridiales bacterium 38_11]HBH13325.1 ribose-5-phosphate isomerase [Clostridiales bacterium]
MKIALASDHAGFELKEIIKEYLQFNKYDYTDYGTDSLDSVDYFDYGVKAAEAVAKGEADRGIVMCGTGIGMTISANKVRGIRCALCHDVYSAEMTRAHNNSNMLAMGGRVIGRDLAIRIVKAWLESDFEGGRHQRRINKIADYENQCQ